MTYKILGPIHARPDFAINSKYRGIERQQFPSGKAVDPSLKPTLDLALNRYFDTIDQADTPPKVLVQLSEEFSRIAQETYELILLKEPEVPAPSALSLDFLGFEPILEHGELSMIHYWLRSRTPEGAALFDAYQPKLNEHYLFPHADLAQRFTIEVLKTVDKSAEHYHGFNHSRIQVLEVFRVKGVGSSPREKAS
ncbi:MAG: hypothetical protein AAFR61_31495 [Bacteroidota bacterium]